MSVPHPLVLAITHGCSTPLSCTGAGAAYGDEASSTSSMLLQSAVSCGTLSALITVTGNDAPSGPVGELGDVARSHVF